ncbi:hypothetical protein [Amnibacterium kyonggiense]|uniref:DUF3137 domain-containing protein n=1 Tax=Amnibacterium kyonggiense TaxID=595671 RepID=A0A4R7FFQ8_9MICO|nr:hypothetical protein [Amnibacterium kyonggiense]TDS75700.1 hypothetical protein CLV52_2807 [Amnibacterium kyonggiense]
MGDARLDLAPLRSPVPRDAVRAYRQEAVARGDAPRGTTWLAVAAVVLIAVVVAGIGAGVVGSNPDSPVGLVFLVVAALVAASVVRGLLRGSPWQLWARLDRFARANAMCFVPQRTGSEEIGMIFDRGHTRITSELMRLGDGWLDGRAETANYRYSITTGSGKNRRTRVYRWAYLVIRLDRHLPQLVLDAVQNDDRVFGIGGSNLPVSFAGSQRLGLEGDFDRFFRLFVPEGYERDALYVLTPDLMALLIDQAGSGAAFDVEIVDDRMYFYAPGNLDFGDPAVWQRLTTIVRTVGTKTLRQTVRYADDRVGDRAVDVVAPQGRRLRRGGAGAAAVLVVAAIAGWWLLTALFAR